MQFTKHGQLKKRKTTHALLSTKTFRKYVIVLGVWFSCFSMHAAKETSIDPVTWNIEALFFDAKIRYICNTAYGMKNIDARREAFCYLKLSLMRRGIWQKALLLNVPTRFKRVTTL